MPKPSIRERFELKYIEEPNTACWLWISSTFHDDYGQFGLGGKKLRAQRVSYELNVGKIPDGMQVLHRCDMRRCVNPDHLWLGTNDDNIADKVAKGRQSRGRKHGEAVRLSKPNYARGELSPHSKLTQPDVVEIRRLYDEGTKQKDIALRFNIRQNHVSRIVRRESWSKWPTQQPTNPTNH